MAGLLTPYIYGVRQANADAAAAVAPKSGLG